MIERQMPRTLDRSRGLGITTKDPVEIEERR